MAFDMLRVAKSSVVLDIGGASPRTGVSLFASILAEHGCKVFYGLMRLAVQVEPSPYKDVVDGRQLAGFLPQSVGGISSIEKPCAFIQT